MISHGNVPINSVLPFFFDAFDGGTGASITMTGIAITDIEIYKGISMTQRASDAGVVLLDTDGIDVDGVTGIHGFSIDTSDNTDAGFYAAGSFYTVVVASVTIDGQTVNFVAGTFRLMAAEAIAGKPKTDVDAWLGTAAATPTVAGVPEVDLTHVAGATTNVSALATNVDAILTDTGTTLQAEVDGIQADTEDIQARLPAALVGGRIDATVDGTGLEAAAAAAIADAVWDEAATGHTDAGKAGEQLWTDIDAILVDTATTLQGELDGIQADTEDIQARLPAALVGGRIDATVDGTGLEAAAAAVIADAVWDEDATGHQTGGTFGQAIGDPGANTETMYDAVVTDAAGTNVAADIIDVEGKVDDLESRLGTPSDLGSGASVAANLVDIEAQTDDIGAAGAGLTEAGGTGDHLTAITWNADWDAEVQSEVADALEATIADSIPADGTRPSVKQALYMITQFMLERAVSSTTVTVKKVDGSTTLFTLTLDDADDPTSITRAS